MVLHRFGANNKKGKIMSKLFYECKILNIDNSNCSKEEQTVFLSIFFGTVKTLATTLARSAEFKLCDFDDAKKAGLGDFTLTLSKSSAKQNYWKGTFEKGDKVVEIYAHLEKF